MPDSQPRRTTISEVSAGGAGILLLALLAFALRLVMVDARLLLPEESTRALAAWQLTQGQTPEWWEAPAHSLATGAAFVLFGAGDGAARLPGVIAGAGLVGLIWLARGWVGSPAALGAAFLVAVSPTSLAVSRAAFEEPLAACLTMVLGWGAIRWWDETSSRTQMLGAAGSALLFQLGHVGLSGFLVLLLFCVAYYAVRPQDVPSAVPAWLAAWTRLPVPFLATTLLVSTGLFLHPDGFGLPAVQAWVRSFETPATAPWYQMWLVIGGYEAPLFLIGIAVAVQTLLRWINRPLDRGHTFQAFLAVWGLLGALLYFFGGQPELQRLFFGMAPLTALSGIFLAERLVLLSRQTLWELLASALPAAVALVYGFLTLSEVAGGGAADPGLKVFTVAASLFIAALFLGIGVAQLARPRAAVAFLLTCAALVFVVHGSSRILADTWMASWRLASHGLAPVVDSVRLAAYKPEGEFLQVAVAQDLKPAVAWYLRDTPGVAYVAQTLPGPNLVLNREGVPLAEAAGYTARSLPLLEAWNPEPMHWRDALRWFLNGDRRPEHIQYQRMIVWTKVM